MNPSRLEAGTRLGKYELVSMVGRGVSASTWRARVPDGAQGAGQAADVILKVLDLSEIPVWSTVDLFRREAAALRALDHPGIPRYVDSFESTDDGRLRLVLAMELVEGRDLESLVASGRRFTEREVESILAGLAEILDYLGSLRPPMVHRDVNPRNVLLRPDGGVCLVDFSGVQEAVRSALNPGATLVGTAGYTPLEQVSGRATPRSDLYGAATTAIFLLTGRNPVDLPAVNLKPDLTGLVDLSPRLARVLGSWLEPDAARRSIGAAGAVAILRGAPDPGPSGWEGGADAHGADYPGLGANPDFGSRPDGEGDSVTGADAAGAADENPGADLLLDVDAVDRIRMKEPLVIDGLDSRDGRRIPAVLPSDSRVTISRSDEGLHITIPPRGLGGGAGAGAGFAAVWIGFVAFWTYMAVRMRAPIFFTAFSIPFWGVGIFMARTLLGSAFVKGEIILNREGLAYKTGVLGRERRQAWPLADLGDIRRENSPVSVNGHHAREVVLETGTRRLRIGAGLSERELACIEESLRDTLRTLAGRTA